MITPKGGRLAPLLVGLMVRQASSPTAMLQAALPRLSGDCSWLAARLVLSVNLCQSQSAMEACGAA